MCVSMKTFGEILADIGFPELLLIDELYGDNLSNFLKTVNRNCRNRQLFFKYLGYTNQKGTYKGDASRLFKTIIKRLGLDSKNLKRYRHEGKHRYPFCLIGEKLPEIQALVRSGDRQKVIQWLDNQYDLFRFADAGIYKIFFKPTGHFYIGCSQGIEARREHHFWILERNSHHNKRLQKLWNESANPFEDFTFEILEKTPDFANKERELIEDFRDNPLMLNVFESFKGIRVSAEIKLQVINHCKKRGFDQQEFVENVLKNYFLSVADC